VLYSKLKNRGYDESLLNKRLNYFCKTYSSLLSRYTISNAELIKFSLEYDHTKYIECKETLNNAINTINIDPISSYIPNGLTNLGNTCYLNSILQVIKFLRYNKHLDNYNLDFLDTIDSLIYSNSNNSRLESTRKVHLLLCTYDNFFNNNIQQDAHEAFLNIINNNNIHLNIFTGSADTSFICNLCFTYSDYNESFNFITRQVSDMNTNYFYRQKTMNKFCMNCKKDSLHTTTYTIKEYPDVLVILINRYIITNSGRCSKNNRNIIIDNTITYNNYTYNIFGIINHIGSSTSNGHYISLIKTDNKWFKCDDSNINNITIDMPHNSSEAYMLFYMNLK
jgi:ubiquitin C-terminal hydrolase